MVVFVRSLLPLAVVAWGLAATLVVVAFFFSYRYGTRIPADFGVRRLYHYGGLVPALLVPGVLEAMTRPIARRSLVAAGALSLVAGAIALTAVVARIPPDRSLARAAAGVKVIESVAAVVPCGVRMLVNSRSAGTWEAWTGRRAVTEGMAPFLRPNVIGRVLRVLIGANEFFEDPQANRAFLARERVQYLVVVKPGLWLGSRGPRAPAAGDAGAVAALPGVQEVFRDRRVTVFTVGAADTASAGEQPRRCPL
jgi:hypothetical protein